jgi:tol-pal system protein YbgF
MLQLRAFILFALCFAAPAQAGLFPDDEARDQIRQLDARLTQQQDDIKQQMEDGIKQQTKSMLDMQGQIDALKIEIRNLRGQNEELAHGLRDAEKREKDFYVDLDTRLRHFESAEKTAQAASNPVPVVAAAPADPNDPALENRAFEAAYGLFKAADYANAAKAFQEFLKKYPGSVHAPNANYWLGDAQFALKDYRGALGTYQGLLKAVPGYPKAADVLFNIAGCQQELKQDAAVKKTLKQLIAKYPSSEAAAKAKKLLAGAK